MHFTNNTVQYALNNLYTDFRLLQSGEWVPDNDSDAAEASIDMLEDLVALLQKQGCLPDQYELTSTMDEP